MQRSIVIKKGRFKREGKPELDRMGER